MIGINIVSGLGNMMFQIAFIKSLGKKYGLEVGYNNVDNNIRQLRSMDRLKGVDLYRVFKNIDLHKTGKFNRMVPISDTYNPIIPSDGTLYNGYAVSERNFLTREFILELFQPNDYLCEKLFGLYETIPQNNCSIHVRRGDYIGNPGFAQLTMGYYENAMDMIQAENYIIFSDDIMWCREHFKGLKYHFIESFEHVELFLMSLCDHNIIANSTFSWWGAYLNKNPGKKVIAPLKWVADNRCTTEDIVPKEWIKI